MYFNEALSKENNYQIKQTLLNQKEKYDLLKNMKFDNNAINTNINNEAVLLPNSLIHGTSFNLKTLEHIKRDGVLASEFSDQKHDFYDETFYMADFFKVVTKESITIKELLTCFNKDSVINYLPETKNSTNSKVAFLVNSEHPIIKKYLELDLFSDNNSELLSFIDEDMFFSINRRKRFHQYNYKLGQSSIPIGVPYSALSAIIIDKNIQDNKHNELDKLIKLFASELFIISPDGKILSAPEQNLDKEIIL